MVVDDKNNFITARGYPELLKVVPTVRNSVLTLEHGNMEPVHVNLAEVGNRMIGTYITITITYLYILSIR